MDTLDVPEMQVLVHFPTAVLPWHHRLLLQRIGGGHWVCAAPDPELSVHDFSTVRHTVLERNSMFPSNIPGLCYGFVLADFSRVVINDLKRLAVAQAAILEDDVDEDLEETVWVFAEPGVRRFVDLLTEAPGSADVPGSETEVVQHRGSEIFVAKVLRSNVAAWRREKEEAEHDSRRLGDYRDNAGILSATLRDAVPLICETAFVDWKVLGPRATREWIHLVRDSSGELSIYHQQFIRQSVLSEGQSGAPIHFVLCEVLRLATTIGQFAELGITNEQSFELLVRGLIQGEVVVSRSAMLPDYCSLEVVMCAPVSDSGAPVAKVFMAWVLNRLTAQSSVPKQTRRWSEEPRLHFKGGDGGKGKGDADGSAGGGGRGGMQQSKKKGKNDAE